ncbi:hypothetical protein NCS57_00350500 [Fusarium keratoplasticum]|uniref:Uncharacterized protein n=1 Tax=Fusarium keratoplasticum TaxID=1328300 RepID=A0ACC0R4Y1_9HYPO|nr:hypothetical protein NCS57_00350500 [Fusarium keratoplasticum]KAI8674525.1 hypothetical protein NCS57_00350500 [Fusarium keratoplasticum]
MHPFKFPLPQAVILSALGFVSCASLARPQEPFQLYAYGEGIGGLVLFSDGGTVPPESGKTRSATEHSLTQVVGIYAGNPGDFDSDQAAPVIFTDNDGTWACSPNRTGLDGASQASWSNLTLAIPDPSSSSHGVELLNGTEDTDGRVTTGFSFYGAVAFVHEAGLFTSLWYGTAHARSGIFFVNWNVTENDDASVLLSIRATPPIED